MASSAMSVIMLAMLLGLIVFIQFFPHIKDAPKFLIQKLGIKVHSLCATMWYYELSVCSVVSMID